LGKVTCNSCSKNKFLLPSQSSKPLRVCDSCFDTLCRGRTSSNTFDESAVATSNETIPAVPQKVELAAAGVAPTPVAEERKSDASDEKKNGGETSDDSGDSDVDVDDLDLDAANLELEDNKPTFYSTSFTIEDEKDEEPAPAAQSINPPTPEVAIRSAPLPPVSIKVAEEKSPQVAKEKVPEAEKEKSPEVVKETNGNPIEPEASAN